MAGKYNTWLRTQLAIRIRENGGYYGRHEQRPLVWMVRVVSLDIEDVQEAIDALVEHEHFINEAHLRLQFPFFEDLVEEALPILWDIAVERLQQDLTEDEGLKMWSPETATRYGFDYKGKGADKPFFMGLAGVSSGGKRVAITQFEGVRLVRSNEDLADMVDPAVQEEGERKPSNVWCRQLMGIMDELDKELTTENAIRSGRYYATDYLAQKLGLFD